MIVIIVINLSKLLFSKFLIQILVYKIQILNNCVHLENNCEIVILKYYLK